MRTLRNAFAAGRIAHAFMLTGVRGVGKTTTARIIARALNCIGPDGTGGPTADPCGVCANCVAILADRHPDVVEMDAASRTGVDDMREIIEATRFRPMQARTKVFIIDEVHMLSRNAFNALLKTLEEPPPHVKFIFATTEIRKVPVTVLSRCQRFDLRRVRVAELVGAFRRASPARRASPIEPGALDADRPRRRRLGARRPVAARPGDRPGRAGGSDRPPTPVADMLGLADRGAVFDLLEAVMARPARRRRWRSPTARTSAAPISACMLAGPAGAGAHADAAEDRSPALRDSPELPEAERTRGAALADALADAGARRAPGRCCSRASARSRAAPDRRAAAEMVLIRLCHVADLPTPGDLVRRLTSRSGASRAPPAAPPAGAAAAARAPSPAARMAAAAARRPAAGPRRAAPRQLPRRRRPGRRREREAMLHAHLLHSVHLVRFAPPVIELRPEPDAPRDLAAASRRPAAATRPARAGPSRCRTAAGEPTLAEQGNAADAARRSAAADHPLVRAILGPSPARASSGARPRRRRLRPAGRASRRRSAGLAPRRCRIRRPIADTDDDPDGDRRMKNLAGLMKQASQMQAKMQEMQAKLEAMEIEGAAGAGMVTRDAERQGRPASACASTPSSPIPPRCEMLQDLIVAAHADAKRKIEAVDGRGDAEGHRRHAAAAGHEAAVLTSLRPSTRLLPTHEPDGRTRGRAPDRAARQAAGHGPAQRPPRGAADAAAAGGAHAAAGRRAGRGRARGEALLRCAATSTAAIPAPSAPTRHRDRGMICVVESVGDLWALERAQRASRPLSRARRHAVRARRRRAGGSERRAAARPHRGRRRGRGDPRPRRHGGRRDDRALADRPAAPARRRHHARSAQGVPIGGALDVLDDGTLAAALRARRPA